ncbi:MAG: sister chromatid cohesion protein PDS5 [Candidatus Helarchaeota archaeon]
MDFIDLFFFITFIAWVIIGIGIYRRFYTSLEEILATTEIKKSRAVQHRVEVISTIPKASVLFGLILSIGANLVTLHIYAWVSSDWPAFSYNLFLYAAVFTLIIFTIGELVFLCEKENEGETPYHKVLRAIIKRIIGKVKGKTETVIVFSLIFHVIPIMILWTGLHWSLLFSFFIVFMIYPLIIIAYFIAYTIFRLLTPALFLHNMRNVRLYLGIASIGVVVFFEAGLLISNLNFVFYSLLALLIVVIYGIVKELRYRPIELTHIVDDVMRSFEFVHGAFLILAYGVFIFLASGIFTAVNFSMVPATVEIASVIANIILIQSILIPIFLLFIIIGKAKTPSRAMVVALTNDSMKLNAAIKSRFINDKTLIDTLEKSINKNYIRPEYTPKLKRLLKNEDVHVRRKAIILLRKITEDDRFKSVSIVPELLNFLKHDKIWTVRLEAAESLTQMMNILPQIEIKNVFAYLNKLELDKNRYVRWGIIKLFNSIALAREEAVDNVMKFLFKGLDDEEWSVRKGTIECFTQLIKEFPNYSSDMIGKSLPLMADEDLDIVKEVFNLIHNVTGIEVNTDNLEKLENTIKEKIGAKYTFDLGLVEQAIKKIKEAEKPSKFVFKKSQLKGR